MESIKRFSGAVWQAVKGYSPAVRLYFLYEFLSGMHFLGAVLMVFFTDWGGVNETVALSLQSWFLLAIFLLEVPTGVVADCWGRKYSVALGSFITAIGAIVYSTYPSIYLFVIGETLMATGVALTSGANKALLFDTLIQEGREDDCTAAWSIGRSIHLLAISLGTSIGSLMIASNWGLNMPMRYTAIPVILAGIVVAMIPEPKIIKQKKEGVRNYWNLAKEGFAVIHDHPLLRRWTINSILVAVGGYFVLWLYQPLATSIQVSTEYFGFLATFLVIAEVAALNAYSVIRKTKWGSHFFSIGAILIGMSFLSAAVYPSVYTLGILLAFGGGLGLTRMELVGSEMNRYIESHNRATINSVISMYSRVFQMILNPVVGFLLTKSVVYALLLVSLFPLLTIFFPLNGKINEREV